MHEIQIGEGGKEYLISYFTDCLPLSLSFSSLYIDVYDKHTLGVFSHAFKVSPLCSSRRLKRARKAASGEDTPLEWGTIILFALLGSATGWTVHTALAAQIP